MKVNCTIGINSTLVRIRNPSIHVLDSILNNLNFKVHVPYNMHIQICNQKDLIKKKITNQHMKISLKTPHKPTYSIKDMALNMHKCNVL